VVIAAGWTTACRPDDQRTDSVDPNAGVQDRALWSEEMRMHVDAGNAAIRADSFDVARDHFLAATELEPDVAAGWFGLYMAEQGRGDEEAAAAALERAQAIASGASLIHPEGGDPEVDGEA
jgi:hypothetical protein